MMEGGREDDINDEEILVIRAELTSIDGDLPSSSPSPPASDIDELSPTRKDDVHDDAVTVHPHVATEGADCDRASNNSEHIEAVEQALKDTCLTDNVGSRGPDGADYVERLENGHLTDMVASSASHEDSDETEQTQESLLMDMLDMIANSKLQIRSQQKDEPDFTQQQKLGILLEMYKAKPMVFLERFRKALKEEHLQCFSHLAGNYEVDYYCQEIRKSSLKKVHRTRVRNKRYAALQELIKGGDYFSDEQMRLRDPLMYEHYVGQYLTEEEVMSLNSKELAKANCLSTVMMNSFDEQILQHRLHRQQEQEEACMEEDEEEEEDEKATHPDDEDWVPDGDEKAMLREEFVSRMHQCFLDGKDRDFDYSEVDDNPDFDNLDIVTRDEEERYFDDEEPADIDEMEA